MSRTPPENTGFLEGRTIEAVEPILEELSSTYPEAVQRFRWLFCQDYSEPENPHHKYDPERILDSEEVIEFYRKKSETQPEETLAFALDAIRSEHNNGLGISVLSDLVKKTGWQSVINQMLRDDYTIPRFKELMEGIHKLSTPATLSYDDIKKLLQEKLDDTQFIRLSAYLERRRDAENLTGVSDSFCRDLLRDHDVPFFDEEKTQAAAAELLRTNHEAYHGFLEELRWNIREMNTNYPGEPDPPFVAEQIRQWETMDIDELLHSIYPSFSFNIIMAYMPDDGFSPSAHADSEKGELIRSLMLEESELRQRAVELVSSNKDAFYRALFEVEFRSKSHYSAIVQLDKGNLLSPLLWNAEFEHKKNQDLWGYAINSSALTIAHNTLALYSPTGRCLGLYKDNARSPLPDQMEIANFVSMKHMLSDNMNFSPAENAAAVMLIFWKRLPTEWQNRLYQIYDTFDINLDEFIEACPDSFELAVSFSQDIASLLARQPSFITALNKYVDYNIETFKKQSKVPEDIDVNQFLVLMNSEFGQTDFDEKDVQDILDSLDFDTTLFLQKSLSVDFEKISRREFFSLILYLKTEYRGTGFKRLRDFLKTAASETSKTNRIKAFLSIDKDSPEMSEKILALGERFSQETADIVFGKYAEIIRNIDKIEAMFPPAPGSTTDSAQFIHQIRKNLISKATALLTESREVLRKIDHEYDLSVREYDADQEPDERVWEKFKRSEQEQEQELIKQLESINASTLLFLNTFRIVKGDRKDFDFSEIKGVELFSVSGSEISKEDRAEMRQIYRNNYSSSDYPESFRDTLLADFDTAMESPETTFYVVKKDGHAIAFNRFDHHTDGSTHFGSFNVKDELAHAKIGDALFQASFKREESTSSSLFEAACDSRKPVASYYIKQGFVATGVTLITGNTDQNTFAAFTITRDATKKYLSKSVPFKTVPTLDNKLVLFRKFSLGETEYDNLFEQGYVITRYHISREEGSVYCVFEKASSNTPLKTSD